jgi:hypothetical protein
MCGSEESGSPKVVITVCPAKEVDEAVEICIEGYALCLKLFRSIFDYFKFRRSCRQFLSKQGVL